MKAHLLYGSREDLVLYIFYKACSSEWAIFFENGPFKIINNSTLRKNKYSWNKIANMLYVDYPPGTGFSVSN